jgi:hypothetical protein
VPNLPRGQSSPYSDHDSVLDRRSSQGSQRFRESTHLIPTPGSEGKISKPFQPVLTRLWVVIGIGAVMISLAIAIEVALYLSQKNSG